MKGWQKPYFQVKTGILSKNIKISRNCIETLSDLIEIIFKKISMKNILIETQRKIKSTIWIFTSMRCKTTAMTSILSTSGAFHRDEKQNDLDEIHFHRDEIGKFFDEIAALKTSKGNCHSIVIFRPLAFIFSFGGKKGVSFKS